MASRGQKYWTREAAEVSISASTTGDLRVFELFSGLQYFVLTGSVQFSFTETEHEPVCKGKEFEAWPGEFVSSGGDSF